MPAVTITWRVPRQREVQTSFLASFLLSLHVSSIPIIVSSYGLEVSVATT